MATKKKPVTTETHPRLIKKGDAVLVKGTTQEEVVRSVSIVLHLSNGQDVVYTPSEKVDLIPNPDPDFVAAKAEIDHLAEAGQ